MRKYIIPVLILLLCSIYVNAKDKWPDGTTVSEWFAKTRQVDVKTLGRQYIITDHGVERDSALLQTEQIQAVIDKAAANGGGVVVIPEVNYLSGSLFIVQDVVLQPHLNNSHNTPSSQAIHIFCFAK